MGLTHVLIKGQIHQGDFQLHTAPGDAFFPSTDAEAEGIVMHKIDAPFQAAGDVSYGRVFLECD